MLRRACVYGRQSSGKAKSINEQLKAGKTVILDEGWVHAGDYSDGTAASRFKTKAREEWDRLLADLKTGVFHVIVLWESSRGDRTLGSWADFLEDCRTYNVLIHVIVDDHTYDLSRPRDWKTLATAGVDAAAETDMLSLRVRRGHHGAAAAGKPGGGPTPFGYRRSYDPETGKRLAQTPHEPHAKIVREIFSRVAEGKTLLGLEMDLNQRGFDQTGKKHWTRRSLREMVISKVYIGYRVVEGVEYKGTWDPLVSDDLWYAANELLASPGRRTTRPGRQKHLLSYLGRGACGGWLNKVAQHYRCAADGCVSIPWELADQVVTGMILARFSQPNASAILNHSDDADAMLAQVEAARLRKELDKWRTSAVRGETSPESLAVIEAELKQMISDAEAREAASKLPASIQAMLDPSVDVRERWTNMSVVARRNMVRGACDIRVGPGRPGRYPAGDVEHLTLGRLGKSRWTGDSHTWSELLQM